MRTTVLLLAALGVALTTSGCSGGSAAAPPKIAAQSLKPAAPWHGAGAWTVLGRLPNYAYTSSIAEGYNLQALILDQDDAVAGGDYRMDVRGKARRFAFLGATSLIYLKGQHYVLLTAPPAGFSRGWLALGQKLQSPYSDIETEYAMLPNTWQARLAGSRGTFIGPCSLLGRSGDLFRIGYAIPADAAIGDFAAGSACIDRATGAPLRLDLSLHTHDAQRNAVVFEDHFRLTAIGSVRPITAPQGAKPAPSVTLLP